MIPLVEHPYKYGTGWGFMRLMDIPDVDRPTHCYLRRLIIFKTPAFALYLHWIYTCDNGPDPHNHPMSFVSLVLRGGYREIRGKLGDKHPWQRHTRIRKPGSFAFTSRKDFHFIKELFRVPTVTLLFCGPRFQDWGYDTSDGFVSAKIYHKVAAND